MSAFDNHNIHNYQDQEGIIQMIVAPRADWRTEWDDTTIMVLLCLIIETGFYVKHLNSDSGRKASLWSNLHAEFCINPDVIRFAGTSAGHQFSLKYRDLKYVKERFQTIKKEFRKVVVDIQRAGSVRRAFWLEQMQPQ
ncbi:hypothetical protein J3Q64DRAFT_1828570 [Phycomyces blakesleeanus]|uniref:Homeodomain-like DNA binding domain-containing transcription factor n=1 Tax=Phycomyces blakesleeanus TaxID=4837 RepID=A0ABR3BFZ1_PHYBL